MRITLVSHVLSVVVVLVLAQGSAPAAFFQFNGGLADNFGGGAEPASPSIGLQSRYPLPPRQYDDFQLDSPFLETFNNLPCCIIDAQIEMVVAPQLGSFSEDDTIQFSFTDNSGVQSPIYWQSHLGNPTSSATLHNQSWNAGNFQTPVTLTFNLSSMPGPHLGTTTNLLPMMNTAKYLDVVVEDNTEVDFISLQIQTQLAGDVNGDGCVDADDIAIFTQNFGNRVPVGLGDPNGDGIYDANDAALIQSSFGQCCNVPEPGTTALLTICMAAYVAGRRRK